MSTIRKHGQFAQLLLRFSLGAGFLSPVFDRFGWLGMPGENNIAWGNWAAFIDYVHVLLPFLSKQFSNFFGSITTIIEIILGICLIIGLKTRYEAMSSFLLTLVFVICMTAGLGFKAPLIIRSLHSVQAASCCQQCQIIAGAWTVC